jgi:hypothetical protein
MSRFVDNIITLRILRLLTTPFDQTEAYRLGIIDAKGRVLKKDRELNSVEERDAYSILHRMVYRLKRIIEKVPVQGKKLASYAAALALIKEHTEKNYEPINLEELFLDKLKTDLTEDLQYVKENISFKKTFTFKQFSEDAGAAAPIANNAGSPGVAGFTPDTLGVPKGKQPPLLRRKKIKND